MIRMVILVITILSYISAVTPKLLFYDSNNLHYVADIDGNFLPDFSQVGYQNSNITTPTVPTVITLSPSDSDDELQIEMAIDSLTKLPTDDNGIHGAVLLSAGTYEVSGTINIAQSGVVLRGEEGTVIIAKGYGNVENKRTLISIAGNGKRVVETGTTVSIIDDFVPTGSRSFTVSDGSNFSIGDNIILERPSPENWIYDILMDTIPPRPDGKTVTPWAPDSYNLTFERTITSIVGNLITIDIPIVLAIEAKYNGATIAKYSFENRAVNVGIENLTLISEFDSSIVDGSDWVDENHGWTAVEINIAENCWVR